MIYGIISLPVVTSYDKIISWIKVPIMTAEDDKICDIFPHS